MSAPAKTETASETAPASSRRAPASAASKPPRKPRRIGRIELRLVLSLIVMAAAPLVIGVLLALFLAKNAVDLFYNPRVTQSIESSLSVYRPLVRALKADMHHRADAIAASEPLRAAAALHDASEVDRELKEAFAEYSDKPAPPIDPTANPEANPEANDGPLVELVALEVYVDLPLEDCLQRFIPPGTPGAEPSGKPNPATETATPDASKRLAHVDRGTPIDPKKDYLLVQCKPLGPDEAEGPAGSPSGASAPMLVATFSTDRARIDQRDQANEFLEVYKGVEERRGEWVRLSVTFSSVLLAATILVAGAVGLWFARSVSRRVKRVADAAVHVAGGDLEVRVPEEGDDELGDLAVSFNRMLGEIERSRARIEYLQRVGAWQDMARRLAHEIKNPLTPIQLAVEEVHHKYAAVPEKDAKMQKLLDTTLEIVTEEVGTLRRLVSEFSAFARLPRARLKEEELVQLLGDVKATIEALGKGTEQSDLRLTPSGGQSIPVRVSVSETIEGVSAGEPPIRVAVDKQMIRKSLDNLVRNAVQAIRAKGNGWRVIVHATVLDDARVAIDVDDDGPGVPDDARERVFDPYFTTRTEGTGLGLAIVKKIIVEHGGAITCDVSPMGGARFRIVLPSADSPEARAAVELAERVAPTSRPDDTEEA